MTFTFSEMIYNDNLTQASINLGWASAKTIRNICKDNGLPTARTANANLQTARKALYGVAKLSGLEPSAFESWDWAHELVASFECETCGDKIEGNIYDVRGKGWVVNAVRVMCANCW